MHAWVFLLSVIALLGSGVSPVRAEARAVPGFVGAERCSACHIEQGKAWRTSQHAHAMQHAGEDSVLGDFADATFTYAGDTSRFFRRDGRYYVKTDGPDGKLHDYEIRYTFGIAPLQQYLIELPGGRLQALSIAWDARPRVQGGQRWYHLYPDEKIDHRDELHWTRRQQNWNYMCADCHSTALRKNYDAKRDRYDTTWSEINVACEACHGPGAEHVTWAEQPEDTRTATGKGAARRGLATDFSERPKRGWLDTYLNGTRQPAAPKPLSAEIEVCAPCHALRTGIADGYSAGKPWLDHYRPSQLVAPGYFADGQQHGEVFTWGSFVQSRMYQRGVTCSDCHEPHSGSLRVPGNSVCAQCHEPARFDTSAHHRHAADSSGSQCTACHMPTRLYMGVDARHDHSLRVPRPDLAVSHGTPDACTTCHTERKPDWAAGKVREWLGRNARGTQQHLPGGSAAEQQALVDSPAQPALARASALVGLAAMPSQAAVTSALRDLNDPSPQVRESALSLIALLPPEQRLRAAPLLAAPRRSVRNEAARVLAPAVAQMTPTQRQQWQKAAGEFEATQRFNADRPEAWVNLGNFYAAQARTADADRAFAGALRLQRDLDVAWAGRAEAKRAEGNEAAVAQTLREGLRAAPRSALLHHGLGLSLIRSGQREAALGELTQASRLAPDNPRYVYVQAIALDGLGRRDEARSLLRSARKRFGDNAEIAAALAAFGG